MNRFGTIMRKTIALGVLTALLFNSVGALFAASSMLSYAQGFADEDKVLICTGSTYKWISLSTFELTGKVEYVEAPENAPSDVQEIKCSYAYLADPNPDAPWVMAQIQLPLAFDANIAIGYVNALYATARHQLPLSRAPPCFS